MSPERNPNWASQEVEAVVESYFRMLRCQLTGQPYVKRRENEWVQQATGRSRTAVEYKFQNVSAVLLQLGAGDFVRGYLPMRNAQQALRDAVSERWRHDREIEALMVEAAESPLAPVRPDVAWTVSDPPSFTLDPSEVDRRRSPVRIDFLKLDADRRDVGLAGEEAVVALERTTLEQQGLDRLARRVEHVSRTRGDGLGYDVLSFDRDGTEKFIEVKTTRRQREFPFFASRNEVEFSADEKERFHLYRVYDFGQPRTGLFMLDGALDATCVLTPAVYEARAAS